MNDKKTKKHFFIKSLQGPPWSAAGVEGVASDPMPVADNVARIVAKSTWALPLLPLLPLSLLLSSFSNKRRFVALSESN